MITQTANKFTPDYVISPGEILEETLEARGIKKKEFAERCGLSDKTVSLIIHGKAPVLPETAIQFERVLGVSAAIWNNLEAAYRLHHANKAEQDKLNTQRQWAKRFPVNELAKRGFIEKPDDAIDAVRKLLNFFAVASIEIWEKRYASMLVAYRHSPSFKSAPEAVATWLRIGELVAERIETAPYSRDTFLAALNQIRSLTSSSDFEHKMKTLCQEAGIALVFVPEFKNTRLSGATRWLTKDKALIILSLRHKRDDHLWFSFFHESAHILHHGKKETFLDEKDTPESDQEKEADAFAADFLIPAKSYRDFIKNKIFSEKSIRLFAEQQGIAPGIIVGRLQRDKQITYGSLNHLKRVFEFKTEIS
ncbi:HigA family addiction module antitoxin [Desulfomonile tiedjei]|uniref:Addiction module antidote protein, HigA family n=1 Tax=Desulfomonile tiedjei (strain ATCC 49306 / DSM 6799 / DCB-1) TaxID=706587 RepID=I4C5M3_DESTA|nr:HigA family addiction module antitoxin [Desulfomonile tiedjei]AFM24864.1 addiction module antidote protein, HigA family [Desulfomonile tiedjei DSM 6799]